MPSKNVVLCTLVIDGSVCTFTLQFDAAVKSGVGFLLLMLCLRQLDVNSFKILFFFGATVLFLNLISAFSFSCEIL